MMSEKHLLPLVGPFFVRAKSYRDTSRTNFERRHRVSTERAKQEFPIDEWLTLRKEWALKQVRDVMDELYRGAVTKEDFTVGEILKKLKAKGIERQLFTTLAGAEWEARRTNLPTAQEKISMAIKDLVAMGIPVGELTSKRVIQHSGVKMGKRPWLPKLIRAARLELLKGRDAISVPPDGINGLLTPGGWIDLDSDVWDLRPPPGKCIKRSLLRDDLADIAWAQLRQDLLDSLSCGTLSYRFDSYRWAGDLLGAEVPDIRRATLEGIQRAWLKYDARPVKLRHTLIALRRLFSHLCEHSLQSAAVDRLEMLRIAGWLYTSVTVRVKRSVEDFLSEEEMTSVIAGCLVDIKAGLGFTDSSTDILNTTTHPDAENSSYLLVNWAEALMLLLMLFTGLRRQSVINLEVGDWVEIRPKLFILIWRHGKKREEKTAVLAASVARLLDVYVQRTAELREALGAKKVFLTRGLNSYWGVKQGQNYLSRSFKKFAARHGIRREDELLKIDSLILRRTYVTRELYEGRSIWALRLQLGHESILSTRGYGKFDLYEHPAEVAHALDGYGKRSLTLWHHPTLLADLDPSERERLLGLKYERHQDVGLCRFNTCVKMAGASPPPCSLCEHLVTGPDFLEAWEEEDRARGDEIRGLSSVPEAAPYLAEKRSQYAMFKVNFDFTKGENHP